MLVEIIIATVIVSLFAFTGLLVVHKKIDHRAVQIKWIISLAAGALLAVTFLDLLPEAVEMADAHKVMLTALITFLAFFILERILHWHHCHCPEDKKAKGTTALTNLIGDGFHNLIDGFLIASTFMISTELGIVTTIAVILHEIPQEISDYGVLIYAGYSKKKSLILNFIFASTVILGGIIFYYFGQIFEGAVPYMAAVAAGTFIYLAAADLIPELHHERSKKQIVWQTVWVLIGALLIYGANSIIPHSHDHEAGHEHEIHEIHEEHDDEDDHDEHDH